MRRASRTAAGLGLLALAGGLAACGGASRPQAPVVTPAISGLPRPGQDLTCTAGLPTSAQASVRWESKDADGHWSALPDTIDATYTVNPAEPGGALRCRMDVTTANGRTTGSVSPPTQMTAGWTGPSSIGDFRARVFIDRMQARVRPSRDAPAVGTLKGQSELLGGTKWIVITDVRRVHGKLWAKVLLSTRPNGLEGWVPDQYLDIARSPVRVLVDQSAHRMQILRAGRVVATMVAGVGSPTTPTPNGRYGVESHIPTATGGPYGPMVIVLTGHSDVLKQFDGGDGRLAIHGTNRPTSIGTAQSFGCVHLGNRDVMRAARLIPDGALVTVRA